MKYFTKYLPVEGEIKDGDKMQWNDGSIDTCNCASIESSNLKKVKLYLCSRGIQVGDEVRVTKDFVNWFDDVVVEIRDNKGYFTDSQDKKTTGSWYRPNEIFKVIGEISPDATWVKEGDEFDEDDVRRMVEITKGYLCPWIENRENMGYSPIIQIKGPCGHFH